MEFRGLKINLAELAMALTALGALITAWRGARAVRKRDMPGKGKNASENSHGD